MTAYCRIFWRCRRARLEPGLIGQQQSDDHAAENGEDRSANDRKRLPSHQEGQRDNQTEQQARSLSGLTKFISERPFVFVFPLIIVRPDDKIK